MGQHKIITCTGYGGTGSSVITDLLKEYDNVKSTGCFELSIAHEMDGISDLQHYIVDDFNRNKVSEGLYRFRRLTRFVQRGYDRQLGGLFTPAAKQYLRELEDLCWQGSSHLHMRRGSRLNMYACHAMPAHIQMLLHKLRPFTPPYEYAPRHRKHPMSMSYGEARFFEATRRFYTTLFDGLDPQYEYEYLALDQLVPPNNLERYTRYFDNIKTIVIDRDPRDLYLLNKLFWKEGWIPTDSTEVFIKWFELIRRHRETEQSDPRQVLHLRFEDCLLDYDATVARIETFLGIGAEHHVRPRTVFSPDRSAKNFRLWERYPGHDAEIATIERALGPYCYGTR